MSRPPPPPLPRSTGAADALPARTEFVPTTQMLGNFDAPENPVAVCSPAGDVVLMDYRIKHRGMGNNSTEPRPLLYITYAKKGWTDRANFSSRRYRALPELDDTKRFKAAPKRQFQRAGAAAGGEWSVSVDVTGSGAEAALRVQWRSPSPLLEIKAGIALRDATSAAAASYDTKRRKGPLSDGVFIWPLAAVHKRFVAKGPLIAALWDESFPERPSAYSAAFLLSLTEGGELQVTGA